MELSAPTQHQLDRVLAAERRLIAALESLGERLGTTDETEQLLAAMPRDHEQATQLILWQIEALAHLAETIDLLAAETEARR